MSTSFTRGENPLKADKLNQAFSERVLRSGDTMTGRLTLNGDPVAAFDAATKQYVDRYVATTGPTVNYNNVLDYGADPSGAVDSSAAFNNAASHVAVNGHRKPVYMPTGTYRLDHQIRLTDGQTLFGDGEGSSYFIIFDNFDPTASSVILCTGSVIDPGPTIRDLGFWFMQPNDLSSRSTMKPLGAGGSSYTPGGTGVQYPWAIMAESASAGHGMSGRIQVQHVLIFGAWNGIHADNACFWIDGLKISAFNIGIAMGGTTADPVADWSFVSNVEFWTFGLWSGQANIFMDDQTIAMRIGAQNGLVGSNISCFTSRLVFTNDALGGWFAFTNLSMDGHQSTIELADAFFANFVNVYYSAADTATRPGMTFGGNARVNVSNVYAHSSSALPILRVQGGANVTFNNATFLPYALNSDVIQVQNAAILQITNVKIYPAAGAWTRPLLNQYDTSSLSVDNINVMTPSTGSGVAVQFNSDQVGNYVGNISKNTNWTRVVGAFGDKGHYGDVSKDGSSVQFASTSFSRLSTTAHHSTGFGNLCLDQHQDGGNDNTAMGWLCGFNVTTGTFNTFMGSAAGFGATGPITGTFNSAYGANTARNLTTGINNLFLGAFCGQTVTTGSGNIFIGYGMDGLATTSNVLNIGNIIYASGINTPATAQMQLRGKIQLNDLQTSPTYTNDAAAAAGGVIVGGLYRNGSQVMIRVV